MTKRFQRYAIYWTPEPGSDLAAFGMRWFGPGGAETFGLRPELAHRAIEAPARYGLHATLKAPFRLREGSTAADLQAALDGFCAARRGPSGGTFVPAPYQDYLCLVPSGHSADIDWLAHECVTHFDAFRAPLTEDERRSHAFATPAPREQSFIEEFGYPYVLSAFRFHVSLAGPLAEHQTEEVAAALRPHLAPFMAAPVRIGSLSLLGEPDGGGAFELLSRHRLR